MIFNNLKFKKWLKKLLFYTRRDDFIKKEFLWLPMNLIKTDETVWLEYRLIKHFNPDSIYYYKRIVDDEGNIL